MIYGNGNDEPRVSGCNSARHNSQSAGTLPTARLPLRTLANGLVTLVQAPLGFQPVVLIAAMVATARFVDGVRFRGDLICRRSTLDGIGIDRRGLCRDRF